MPDSELQPPNHEMSLMCDLYDLPEQDTMLRKHHEASMLDSELQPPNHEMSLMCDLYDLPEQDTMLRKHHEALSVSDTTMESMQSQEQWETASIPEMVEDALEVISQDGDYLERIGLYVNMQCILCAWAGPKVILECHIRQEHANQIHQQPKNEWNITYKLGSLVNQEVWLSEVCEHDNVLYALSVKYEDPDGFMACVSRVSDVEISETASITIYNKVTGEPHTWQGQLQELPTNMPYENDSSCLKVQLSKLDLLPNSANLKLMNRELVLKSPTKVVVGQPELNDIHIIMFVNIF